MALRSKSLFLWGYEVTDSNSSIDFKGHATDTQPRRATLSTGYYSLTSLLEEIVSAITQKDPLHTYTATANRSILGGLQNRITITSNGSYFRLLFASGPRTASNAASLMGFTVSDFTGSLSYTGTLTTGIALVPSQIGYNYLSPTEMKRVFGSVNVSTSGIKEAIVFNVQEFWQAEFKYEPKSMVDSSWSPFLMWAIQQRRLEFTPEYSSPNTFYDGTLETTSEDGKALAFKLSEMLPSFPHFYTTGLLKFRRSLV